MIRQEGFDAQLQAFRRDLNRNGRDAMIPQPCEAMAAVIEFNPVLADPDLAHVCDIARSEPPPRFRVTIAQTARNATRTDPIVAQSPNYIQFRRFDPNDRISVITPIRVKMDLAPVDFDLDRQS